MTRWAVLLLSSAFITMAFALLGFLLGLPLFAVPLIGLAIAGIMWWRWPWALGTSLGTSVFAALVLDFNLPLSLLLGAIIGLEGALPAWIFWRRRQLYDLSQPAALVLFLIHGVVLNTLGAAALTTAALVAFGVIERSASLYTFALLWLIHALTALKLTLPILRFGTSRLQLDGRFATSAAAQRGIRRPQFSRDDVIMLAEILSVLAMFGWLINLRTLISPQIISTLFLLPMIWFAVRRGFDGALLAGLTGTLTALGVMLGPAGRAELIVRSASEQRSFATIVFELVVFYLASMVIGLLIDAQRAERRRLETLLDLNRMVAETTDQTLLLGRLADAVHEALAASTCIIARYDATTHALQPLATTTSVPLSPLLQAPLIATNYPALTRVLETGDSQTVHINQPQLAATSSAFFAETGYITALLVPLQRNNRIFGLVEVFDVRPERQFSLDEVRLVEAMGSRGAGAMEQARLITALREHTEQLAAVSDITSILNATLDLDVVCRDIARQIDRVVPHDLACVALFDPGTQTLRVVMSTQPETLAKDDLLPLAAELATSSAETQPLELAALDLPWADHLLAQGIHDALLVPLCRENQPLGVLLLASEQAGAFRPDDQNLLRMLAHHMALAIFNARLFAELGQTYRAKQEAQDMLLQTERFRALGELASGIAHDFNNLLAGILGHTQLLLMEDRPHDGLRIIEQAARDGTQMVHRLQEFARSRQHTHVESLDVNQIVRDVVELARPRWRARDPSIAIEPLLELGEVPIVNGSAFELREVLINLIFNAVDAMPSGGTLTLQTGVEHNGVTIEVRDTGIGMSEETLAQMWTPFFSTKGVSGTGLGLTMTHTIVVQQYGGRLNVQSREGHGTAITVWLPLYDETAAAAPALTELGEQRKARILLVEQEPLVQSALAGLIETLGHDVTCADTGQAGLAAADQQRFDVVITDISLTDVTAWELMGIFKQRDPQTRTILLTVWGTNIDAEQGGTVMDAMIPKPFEADIVRETLIQLLTPAGVLDP